MTISSNFTVFHADHGITEDQMAHIQNQIASGATEGVLLETGATNWPITIPANLGSVPCGLHGPAMDDEPVPESEVQNIARGEREWTDRLVDRPFRPVDYVQVIGIQKEDGSFLLFTVYGGPLAPQNPADPTCQDVPTSTKFWADHALSL
jgi:hypothetical protein